MAQRRATLRQVANKNGVIVMPKLKTNRAAAKRFRKTANGFKADSAGRRHNLGHKPRKTKRQLRSGGSSLVDKSDVGRCTQLLPEPLSARDEVDTMARVKAWRHCWTPSQEGSRQGEGLLQRPPQGIPRRQAGGHQGGPVRLPRPHAQEARLPRAVDRAHQRGGPRARPVVQPPDQRAAEGRHRDRPQDAGRARRARRRRHSAPSASRPRPSCKAA